MISVQNRIFLQADGRSGGAAQRNSFYGKFYPDNDNLSAEDYKFKNFALNIRNLAQEKGKAFQIASLLFKKLQDDFGKPGEGKKALSVSKDSGSSTKEMEKGGKLLYFSRAEKYDIKVALQDGTEIASAMVSQDSNRGVSFVFSVRKPSGDQQAFLYPVPLSPVPLEETLLGFFSHLESAASQ